MFINRGKIDFDYIIVGGGTAGCVAAHKLATERQCRILILEAGPHSHNPMVHIPAGYLKLLDTDKYMWRYKTTPQSGLHGRSPFIPQGKILGGGSSVNAMVYSRGHPDDYESWRRATGEEGWDFNHLLPYFKELEGNQRLGEPHHGVAGLMKVSDPQYTCEISRAYIESAQGIGLQRSVDFNGDEQAGVGYFQTTTFRGKRCSAVDAFLAGEEVKRYVQVCANCMAEQILFSKSRAIGIRYRHNGHVYEVHCTQEVLLAAGALSTPKLLMLSGIGSANHLETHQIPVRLDLPGVGENLQDHFEVPVLCLCNGRFGYFGEDRGIRMIVNGVRYLLTRSGPAMSNGLEAGAFLDPDSLTARPTIQQFCVPSVFLDKDQKSVTPSYGFTINSCVLCPKSRGNVRLATAAPDESPIINPRYLSEPEDARLAVRALVRAREIVRSEPLRSMVLREALPLPEASDPEELEMHVRTFAKTVYHPVGTCAMGSDSSPDAVVTPRLKVRGIDGLRVIDASVMPTIPSGNTNAIVMATAARAMDLLDK